MARDAPVAPAAPEASNTSGRRKDPLLSLLQAVQGGEERAFAEFYDRTSARLFGLAMTIVGNEADAEDALSEVYQQVWQSAANYSITRGAVMTWLMMITRSRCLDLLRRRKPTDSWDEETIPQTSDEHLHTLKISDSGNEQIADALLSLPGEQRQLIALAFFRGLSHQEIADGSGMPLGTVKSHIRRGLAKMRENMDQF